MNNKFLYEFCQIQIVFLNLFSNIYFHMKFFMSMKIFIEIHYIYLRIILKIFICDEIYYK